MFRYKLQQFMYGRYGMDELSFVLIIISVVMSVIMLFFSGMFNWVIFAFRIISYIPIIIAFVRAFSRNIEKRRAENERWLCFKSKFSKDKYGNNDNCGYSSYGYNYSNNNAKKVKYKEDKKIYKYFKCPHCATKLRVPKGKGKLTITCPKCRKSFKGKS